MNTYTCIKPVCDNTYQSADEEAYYCESCQKQNKALAQEIDKKLKSKDRKQQKSELQLYDEAVKNGGVKGFMRVRL
jgi:hypothetical protein